MRPAAGLMRLPVRLSKAADFQEVSDVLNLRYGRQYHRGDV
jgi:hypothetical protein